MNNDELDEINKSVKHDSLTDLTWKNLIFKISEISWLTWIMKNHWDRMTAESTELNKMY